MTPVTKIDISKLSRDEWLTARMTGIGGSDVAAILGLSTYSTPRDIYYSKKGVKDNGSFLTRTGSHMESLISNFFSEETGFMVDLDKHMYTRGIFKANIDRWLPGPKTFVEIKNMNMMKFNEVKYKGIPAPHNLQMQHYMYVLGLESCWYCAFGGFTLFRQEVKYDKDLYEGEVMQILESFWNMHVLKDIPPDDETKAVDLVKIPDVPNEDILFIKGIDWEKAITSLRDLKGQLADIAALHDEAKDKIKDMMGDNEILDGFNARIYYKYSKGKLGFDKKGFIAENPDIDLEKHYKRGKASRSFKTYFKNEVTIG